MPGSGGPDAYIIDTAALRDRDEIIEVLAHGFHDLAWKEIARHRRRAGISSQDADRALNLRRANPASWD